jgi:carbonic anhydrase/acetyltransferase-like protein (isoleucine patch superfamily)
MGSTILNGAHVRARSLVAAGSLLPQGFSASEGSLIVGVPATVRRELNDAELAAIHANASHYVELAAVHRNAEPQAMH